MAAHGSLDLYLLHAAGELQHVYFLWVQMVMALPILRIFILVETVNELLYSFGSSMGPVTLYGKLLLVVMYFYTVVSVAPAHCIPLVDFGLQIGTDAFSDRCTQYFANNITSFITLVQMFIGEG